MAHIEWLRVLRRMRTYFIVLAVLTALNVLPLVFGHIRSAHGDYTIGYGSGASVQHESLRDLTAQMHVPLSALFGFTALLCLIFATTLGTSLNAHHDSLNLAFTRPASRERLALETFGVDAAAIVLCYALTFLLVCAVPFLTLGLVDRIYVDRYAPFAPVVGIGVAVMFYGLLQAATAWLRGGAGLVVGLTWPVFLIAAIPGDPPFGPLIGALLAAVRFIDPIVYLRDSAAYVMLPAAFNPGDLATLLLTVFALGIAGCAIATLEWRRLEV